MNSNPGIRTAGAPVAGARTPPTQSLTLYWLIDESGSMRMDRMAEALQSALYLGFQKLARPQPGCPLLELTTRTLYFGPAARWDAPVKTPMRDARVAELLPYGQTNIAPALRELTRELQARSKEHDDLAPIVLLLSDGLPTDDYKQALNEFDAACTDAGADRVSIAIGRLNALEFCREFMGDSPFDCLSASTTAALSRAVEDLCGSVIPAIIRRRFGEDAPIPLTPASWMPRILSGSVRGKRLSSHVLLTHSSRQVSDGLAAALIADITLRSPGDNIDPRAIDPILSALLHKSPDLFIRGRALEELPKDEEILIARQPLHGEGIRNASISFVFAQRDSVFLSANQLLAAASASGNTVSIRTVEPAAERSPYTGPHDRTGGKLVSLATTRPGVILIGTQSLRDAFGSEEDFGAVAGDLLRLSLTENGVVKAEEAFNIWLQKASAAGSDTIAAVAVIFPDV